MGRTLLLADDSVTIQKVVALTFASENIEIITASDGQEALDKLEQMSPDVALVDVFMPKRDGYEVCSYIKQTERLQNIPVILLVGAFEPFDPEKARRVGADDYLTKPFQSIRQLVNKVNNLLLPPQPKPEEPLAITLPATETPAPPVYASVTASYEIPAPTAALSAPEPWAFANSYVADETPPAPEAAPRADSYTTDPHSLAPVSFSAIGAETVPAIQQYEAAQISLDDPSIEVTSIAAEEAEAVAEIVAAEPESPLAVTMETGFVAETPDNPVIDEVELEIVEEPLALAAEIEEPLASAEIEEPFAIETQPELLTPLPALEIEEEQPAPAVAESEILEFLPDSAVSSQQSAVSSQQDSATVAETPLTTHHSPLTTQPVALFEESDELLDLETPAPLAAVSDDLLELADEEPLTFATDEEPLEDIFAEPPRPESVSPPAEIAPPSWLEQAALLDAQLELPPLEETALAPARAGYRLDDDILDFPPAPPMAFAGPETVLELAPLPEIAMPDEPAQEAELELTEETTAPVALAEPEEILTLESEIAVEEPESGVEEEEILSFAPESAVEEMAISAPTPQAEEEMPLALSLAAESGAVEKPVEMSADAPEIAVTPASVVAPLPETAAEVAPALTAAQLSPEMIDAIARRVVELMSDHTVREIAWEIVPDMAELHIKRRLENQLRN